MCFFRQIKVVSKFRQIKAATKFRQIKAATKSCQIEALWFRKLSFGLLLKDPIGKKGNTMGNCLSKEYHVSIEDLLNEMMWIFFSYLDSKERLNISLVNQRWFQTFNWQMEGLESKYLQALKKIQTPKKCLLCHVIEWTWIKISKYCCLNGRRLNLYWTFPSLVVKSMGKAYLLLPI